MNVEAEIDAYIASQPAAKRDDLRTLHQMALGIAPDSQLWFLDGRNEAGKIVSNPNIGYGSQRMQLAGGKTRDFYRLGLSANTSGISIYVMGVDDKGYLKQAFGEGLGKASVTGYCIKFKSLADLDGAVLEEVIRFALG